MYNEQAKKGVRTCASQEDVITFVELYAFNNGSFTCSCSSNAHLFMIYLMFTFPNDKSFVPSYILPSRDFQKTIN
jgi:hypothetical protein